MADVEESDDVGMVVLAQVPQQTDLAEHVHGNPVLPKLDLHLLHRHHRVCLQVARFVHCRIGACNNQDIMSTSRTKSEQS